MSIFEYMNEAQMAEYMADEPQEAMVAMHPDGFPMQQVNETVWQTQGNVGNDLWVESDKSEWRFAQVLNLTTGLIEVKDIGVQYWDRANMCVEYQQYLHHHQSWVDSGIRRAKAEHGEWMVFMYGPHQFHGVRIDVLSEAIETAVEFDWQPEDNPACWVFQAPLKWPNPTRVVNVDIQWLMSHAKTFEETGEWQWQSTSASTSAS